MRTVRVYGYHGTSAASASTILQSPSGFRLSAQTHEWLGNGIYFWQDAPARAWEWAKAHSRSHEPAVIGALIRLEDTMDLLDILWAEPLRDAYGYFVARAQQTRTPLPVQTRGAHRLDHDVIEYAVAVLGSHGIAIGAVRAAFVEGQPVFPKSALYDRAHVQVAVRDTKLIEELWQEQAPGS